MREEIGRSALLSCWEGQAVFMKIGGPDKLYRKDRRSHVSQAYFAKEIMCL